MTLPPHAYVLLPLFQLCVPKETSSLYVQLKPAITFTSYPLTHLKYISFLIVLSGTFPPIQYEKSMTPSTKEANKELSKLRCVYTVICCRSDCGQGNRG